MKTLFEKKFISQTAASFYHDIEALNLKEAEKCLTYVQGLDETNCWFMEFELKSAFIIRLERRIFDLKKAKQ